MSRRRKQNKLHLFLHLLREGAQLTQQELADKLYVDRNVISRIETGVRTCNLAFAKRWVAICGGKAFSNWLSSGFQTIGSLEDVADSFDDLKFA
jgi:transcriptional regulator with XRE-family HTH domain